MLSFDQLKAFIESKGLNISQVEKGAKIGNGTLKKWDGNPTAKTVVAIANFLEVSTDFLLGFTKMPSYNLEIEFSEEDLEIVELMHKNNFSSVDKRYILQTIAMIDHYKNKR